MTPTQARDCPELDSWLGRLDELASDAGLRLGLQGHLDDCPACRGALSSLAWGEAPPHAPAAAAKGASLAKMVDRLAGRALDSPPALPDPIDGPDRPDPPAIPGFEGLVEVGHGGMGYVFRAREVALDRLVAIKVFTGTGPSRRSARVRAVREAVALARTRHPNAVAVHASGEVDGLPYLVMEWVGGGTLQARLDREGPLTPRDASKLVLGLIGAVAEAHAMGIVHRDIKPANVLMPEGPALGPKLADNGLARFRDEVEGPTESGLVLGTPAYMGPEQTGLAEKKLEVGPATAVHAPGAMLQATMTGRSPYQAGSTWETLSKVAGGRPEPLEKACKGVPRDLARVVARCLEPSPSRRYRSALELAEDLNRFLEGPSVAARPLPAPLRAARWAKRRLALATAALQADLLVVGGAVGTSYHVVKLKLALAKIDDALAKAAHAPDRARLALRTLSDDAIQAMIDRGLS